MRDITCTILRSGSREELLPDFAEDFPYIASRAQMDLHAGRLSPWHWHKSMELFYMERGALVYSTPGGRMLFPEGSGGMVNSNILHTTKTEAPVGACTQLLHIFEPSLLAGEPGSRISRKYIEPLVSSPQVELLGLFPEDPEQKKTLILIREAFSMDAGMLGYELRLRERLTEIWLRLFQQAQPLLAGDLPHRRNNDKIKQMMAYIQEHYPEKISIPELAASAFLSQRECYRVFRALLHTTPVEYIQSFRLHMAAQMLVKSQASLTEIALACGLGSGSYFGKLFREYARCTPSAYRRIWQDRDR